MKFELNPVGICSWDFQLQQGARILGSTVITGWGESGSVRVGGRRLPVQKLGLASGEWHLVGPEGVAARASKANLFSRKIEISFGSRKGTLKPETLGRTYRLREGNQPLATFNPVHAFTRRMTVEASPKLDREILLFAAWLAILMNRRASSDNGNNGAVGV